MEKKISKFLYDYGELLSIGQGCMDVQMNLINETDYYGCDFSKTPVYMIFFTGADNFFPGLVKLSDELDKCPIYYFDLSSSDGPDLVGNFKSYMGRLLDEIEVYISGKKLTAKTCLNFDDDIFEEQLEEMSVEDIKSEIKKARKQLKKFSDETIEFDTSDAWPTK